MPSYTKNILKYFEIRILKCIKYVINPSNVNFYFKIIRKWCKLEGVHLEIFWAGFFIKIRLVGRLDSAEELLLIPVALYLQNSNFRELVIFS